MATYNGAGHIREQLGSILTELGPDDEVIVVDDASTDNTVSVIEALNDERVQVHHNATNLGYVRTFERALSMASGSFVFLSDQDDVWPSGRASIMIDALENRGSVVAGNVATLGGPERIRGPFGERDWRLRPSASDHLVRNLVRLAASDAPYFGSAMAVRQEVLALALPFPGSVRELHDAWLALMGLFTGSLVHLDNRVVLRRIHAGNTSGHVRSPWKVLRGRVFFIRMCADAWRRTRSASRAGVGNDGV